MSRNRHVIPFYRQGDHVVDFDGDRLDQFADGDHLGVHLQGGGAIRVPGPAGVAMHRTVDGGGTLTFNLQATSPAVEWLMALRKQQADYWSMNSTKTKRILQASPLFSVTVYTGVKETLVATGCAFGDTPAWSTGGPTQTARQFVIECAEIKYEKSVETVPSIEL